MDTVTDYVTVSQIILSRLQSQIPSGCIFTCVNRKNDIVSKFLVICVIGGGDVW